MVDLTSLGVLLDEASQRLAAAERLRDSLGALSCESESRGGHITVQVDGSGNLTDLRVTQSAIDSGYRNLEYTILLTLRQALAALHDRVEDTTAGMGETGAAIVRGYSRDCGGDLSSHDIIR
ncbi:hypothetical protein GCM10022198_19690 [Klugiella xanthotipulae]|uniref:DNA-binding protein YbaB n=2 Tax=Klugiella xanthotipulae TaxID=244735 RepID=A0A543I6W7_9MICO|nr:DNA-binding protein YbaB [Klugiella xanthotipulae]